MTALLGVDTGGTFTDFVLLQQGAAFTPAIRIHKRLSTPHAPEQAILQGIAELGLTEAAQRGELLVVHGSTVATNAALEGKGVRTAFITNRGFKDMLTVGRQTRRELYNLQPPLVKPPVPVELCLETGGRIGPDGALIEALTEQDLEQLKQQLTALQPAAVAINLLFSFVDERYEKAIEAIVPKGIFCSRSSFVLPEHKEYERGMATWLNAWLGPLVERYLQQLQQALAPSPVAVMQSSGGTIAASQAGAQAVNMLLSGPAGGLAAARYIGQLIGCQQLLTFDMGGTSTDVAVIDGDIGLTNEGMIGPYPVAVPMVDMHTIGAGGGSLANLDEGGMLQVGPESAGATPGPACYGLGGLQATVTDANVVLGRLPADTLLAGNMVLDVDAAHATLAELGHAMGMSGEAAALGIIDVANEHMTRALRLISVQRGFDPRQFQLCSFGGAGGLHVCALAEKMAISQALVPIHGGVLSALGMLVAPRERQLSRSQSGLLKDVSRRQLQAAIDEMNTTGSAQLLREGVSEQQIEASTSLDLRYQGQSFSLNIGWDDQPLADCERAFHRAHEQRYGHQLNIAVELVNIRLALKAYDSPITLASTASAAADSLQPAQHIRLYDCSQPVPLFHREAIACGEVITGPALITEAVATTLVAQGWQAQCDQWGNLRLEHVERSVDHQ